jgi:hypothetical protein
VFGHGIPAPVVHQAGLWRCNTGPRVFNSPQIRDEAERAMLHAVETYYRLELLRSTMMGTNTSASCRWPALLLKAWRRRRHAHHLPPQQYRGTGYCGDAAITAHHHLDMRSVQKSMSG